MIQTITGTVDFIESLRGKDADFLLALSNSDTAQIEGITQAGIPGAIHLTPTLDSEFVCTGCVRSLPGVATTPSGVPTPALVTRGVHTLRPFKNIELLNLGLQKLPDVTFFNIRDFGLDPSGSIADGAAIEAMEVFEKGVEFGQNYEPAGEYVILAESVPSGTTTALATALGLGYEATECFSSSFAKNPASIKAGVIDSALANIDSSDDLFARVGTVADNMLIFNAGFVLGANNRGFRTLLAGGTQMAAVLLLVNSVLRQMRGSINSSKIALATTPWIANDQNSDIKALLGMLDFDINSYYATFSFAKSKSDALRLYEKGEAKEGVGAGAALIHGYLNGLDEAAIIQRVESFLA